MPRLSREELMRELEEDAAERREEHEHDDDTAVAFSGDWDGHWHLELDEHDDEPQQPEGSCYEEGEYRGPVECGIFSDSTDDCFDEGW